MTNDKRVVLNRAHRNSKVNKEDTLVVSKSVFSGMRVLKAAMLCAAASFVLCGCGGGSSDKEVNIGFFPNITHSQALVEKNNKSIEKALGDDYTVEWTSFNAGPAEVESLFADEIDIGYIGPVPAVNANVKSDGDVSIIANACDAGAVLIKSSDSDISSVADLDGKTVAIPQVGNTQHLCLLSLLAENNLSTTEEGGTVNVVAVNNSDLQTMFEQGEVDAALPPEPWGSILEKNCGAKVVLNPEEIFLGGNYPTAVVVVRNEFMEEHPDVVEKFLKVHKETTDYINANVEEAAGIVNSQIQEIADKTYEEDILLSAFSRLSITSELNKDAIDAFAKICVDEGFTANMPGDTLIK